MGIEVNPRGPVTPEPNPEPAPSPRGPAPGGGGGTGGTGGVPPINLPEGSGPGGTPRGNQPRGGQPAQKPRKPKPPPQPKIDPRTGQAETREPASMRTRPTEAVEKTTAVSPEAVKQAIAAEVAKVPSTLQRPVISPDALVTPEQLEGSEVTPVIEQTGFGGTAAQQRAAQAAAWAASQPREAAARPAEAVKASQAKPAQQPEAAPTEKEPKTKRAAAKKTAAKPAAAPTPTTEPRSLTGAVTELAGGTKLYQVFTSTFEIITAMTKGEIAVDAVRGLANSPDIRAVATDKGKVGLRLLLAFASGIEGRLDAATDLMRDAITETRRLEGDVRALRLTTRLMATISEKVGADLQAKIDAAKATPQKAAPKTTEPAVTADEEAELRANHYGMSGDEYGYLGDTEEARGMAREAQEEADAREARGEYDAVIELANYNPGDYSVREVNKFLDDLTDPNRTNILRAPEAAIHIVQLEMAGKNRKGIVNRRTLVVDAAREEFESMPGWAEQTEPETEPAPEVDPDAVADAIADEQGLTDEPVDIPAAPEPGERKPINIPVADPEAVIRGMFPEWLGAKDEAEAEAFAEQFKAERDAAWTAAEQFDRMETLETLDALEEYLAKKMAYVTPEAKAWLQKVREMLELLKDPDIPFSYDDQLAIANDLQAVYLLITDDSLRAKVARSEEQFVKAKSAGPKTRGIRKVTENRKAFLDFFDKGEIALKGDHPEAIPEEVDEETGELIVEAQDIVVHSPAVYDAIASTLQQMGYIDPSKYEALEPMLFRLFMIRRSFGPDFEGKILGEDLADFKLSDEEFIVGLTEIATSVRLKGHPLAWLDSGHKLGTSRCYPLPLTPGLARFCMKNDKGNPHGLSEDEYMDYGVNQWNDRVLDEVLSADGGQRNVVLNYADALVERHPQLHQRTTDPVTGESKPGMDLRSPDAFVTMQEALDPTDEWALAHNDENDLKSAALADRKAVMRSVAVVDKKKGPGGRSKKTYHKGVQKGIARALQATFVNQLFLKAGGGLLKSGMVEKTEGIGVMNFVMWVKQRASRARAAADPAGERIDPTPSQELIDAFTDQEIIEKILAAGRVVGSSGGIHMLRDMMASGHVLGKNTTVEVERMAKDEATDKRSFGHAFDKTTDMLITFSIGDFIGNPQLAKLFIKELCYQYSQADRHGRPTMSPAEIEARFMYDPDGFFNEVLQRPEGLMALKFAFNISIASYNMLSASLDHYLDNPAKKAAFGFMVTFFMKYKTNILIRHIPGSTFGMYCAKRGINRAVIAAAEKKGGAELKEQAEGWAADTNMYMIGGESANWKDGAYECALVDLGQIGVDSLKFAFVFALSTFFRVTPPDKDELWYNYKEWKIGDEAWEANWFWGDTLKFIMPTVIAIHAGIEAEKRGMDGGDMAYKVLTYGYYDVIQDNPWVQMTNVFDLVNDLRRDHEQELNRNEGTDVEDQNTWGLNALSYFVRRGIATVEPAVLREIYTETGLFGGPKGLDVSSTRLWNTKTKDDETDTVANKDYLDVRIRRDVKNSVLGGMFMNAVNHWGRPGTTGYMQGDRPLSEAPEPYSQMIANRFTPRSPDGTPIEFDAENPETVKRFEPVVKEIRAILDDPTMTPQKIDGCGYVFPPNARYAVDYAMGLEAAKIWREWYRRRDSGEWWNSGPWDPAKNERLAKEKSRERDKAAKRVAELDAKSKKLWSRAISYGVPTQVREVTTWREIAKYKDGPNAGEVAPGWVADWWPDQVEMELYPSGVRKSNWADLLKVNDRGAPSYDAQAPVSFINEFSDPAVIEKEMGPLVAGPHGAQGKIIDAGIHKGEFLRDVMTGGGATGLNPTKQGGWNNGTIVNIDGQVVPEYLFGLRSYVEKPPEPNEIEREPWDFSKIFTPEPDHKKSSGGGGGWGYSRRGYGGGGGGGSYAPKIYPRTGYSINADRAATMDSKNLNYTRFDYLRPSVQTKGSREAYRREDF